MGEWIPRKIPTHSRYILSTSPNNGTEQFHSIFIPVQSNGVIRPLMTFKSGFTPSLALDTSRVCPPVFIKLPLQLLLQAFQIARSHVLPVTSQLPYDTIGHFLKGASDKHVTHFWMSRYKDLEECNSFILWTLRVGVEGIPHT